MGVYVLRDCKLYVGGWDLSGSSNRLNVEASADLKDRTVFGDAWRSFLPGLLQAKYSGGGFYEADAADYKADDILWSNLAAEGQLVTVCPGTGAAGERADFLRATLAKYNVGGAVGDICAFEIDIEAAGDMAFGYVLANGLKTASGSGTAYQLGAVAEGQRLYAGLHVVSASGTSPTLDLAIESDNAEAMSSPTTRITFAQKTGLGAEWATPVAGPITDDWWRASWTVGGSSPSFKVIVVMGIR